MTTLACLIGCLQRLGGAPEKIVSDNDTSIVDLRRDRRPHEEVAALYGALGAKAVVLDPGHPERKGQVERTNGYLDRSFLSLRSFTGCTDLQDQSDTWTTEVAYRRHHRRVGGRVGEALAAERTYLRALPDPLPEVRQHLEARVMRDAFVRAAGVDYSVPPGYGGRRVQILLSPTEVEISSGGQLIARHARSFVPADVVLAPAHARALRLAREAKGRLRDGDLDLPEVDLGRYDELTRMGA